MATLELVEMLRERANVSYEEAKEALDACGDDLLDAVIYLENQGKVAPPTGTGHYEADSKPRDDHHADPFPDPPGESFSQLMGRFWRFCKSMLHKGNTNMFDVYRHGEVQMTFPITVLVILMVFFFWVVIPLLIVGLFFGFRYRFRGRDLENTGVNKAMEGAAKAAETLKREICEREPHHSHPEEADE